MFPTDSSIISSSLLTILSHLQIMDGAVAIALALALKDKEKKSKKRSKWSKTWFLQRAKYGHVELLAELRTNEPHDYRNFLRMDALSFDELLELVSPYIRKCDTIMRQSISPMERLSLTLRYLATGNTYEDLKFITAISPQSIGVIVIETCEAIIKCLKSYIKVSCLY